MYRAYELWKAYVMFVIDRLFTYLDKSEEWGWPIAATIALPLLPLFAADWFLPRWASLSVCAAVGVPMAWFLGSMFYVYFAHVHGRDRA